MNRLVILAPNWLGDAVMALPAIADVRRAAPAASISVAARATVAPLFALVPEVNDTLVLGHDAAQALAAKDFDTALLFPNSTRAALVARRSGIPERWGYRTGWRGALLTRSIPPARGLHQIEYYQRLVQALGFPNGSIEPRVTVSIAAREAGRKLLTASGWDGRMPLVAIAPGAAYGGAKRWPAAYFEELVDGLAGEGVQCVMVGTAADAATAEDVARAFQARDRGPKPPSLKLRRSRQSLGDGGRAALLDVSILNLVGRTDLSTLAGVLASCRALVTNDSGAMHLAAAIGISVAAIFGPTNERATSPRTPNPDSRIPNPDSRTPNPDSRTPNPESRITILTHSTWCRPCMLRECPLDHRCMRRISVAAVLEAARSGL